MSTISGFNRPNGIALDLDNNRFFVSNFTSGVVSVVNATTYSIINTISVGVGNGGQGLFYDADNNRLLVALYYSACRVIDLNTNTIVGSFGGGSSLGITLDKTGNKIVMGTEFSVSTYDATTYAYIATYPLGEGVDIAIDAEHDRIFVSDYSGKISIVKLSTMSLTRTIVTAPNLTGLWWDGVKLFYVTYLGNKLYMLK